MDLQSWLDILKRRALVITVVTALTVVTAVSLGVFLPPIYEARATVRVMLDVGVTDLILREDYNERLLNTYAEIVTSTPVLDRAISSLPVRPASLTASKLRERVGVEIVPNTELLHISVRDGSPSSARDLANALSALLIEYAQSLYVGSSTSTREIIGEQLAGLEDELLAGRRQLGALVAEGADAVQTESLARQIDFKEAAYDRLLDRYELARLNESLRANSIALIAPATLPSKSTTAPGLTEVGLSLGLGLFGGIGFAFILENLDKHVHSPQQVEGVTNLPVLGRAPNDVRRAGKSGHRGQSGHARLAEEAYRLLSLNVLSSVGQGSNAHKTLLVTSAEPEEGKSTVALNLAQAFAEQGRATFLIEGDLRRPWLAKALGVEGGPDLHSLLSEEGSLDVTRLDQLSQLPEQPNLHILGGGAPVSRPTMLLASSSMDKLIQQLEARADIIILDAPPVLGMADVAVLAPKVDGVILVVREDTSRRDTLREAYKQLQMSRAHVLGMVFLEKNFKGRWYG